MTIDLFTASGEKKGTLALPAALFEAPINRGLMHQALVRQQSNRRNAIAHVKTRGEVVGSTKKVYAQKGTGRARRGPIRSPLLRGGGKTFGPRSDRNFTKDMPRAMRRAALLSCLSFSAKEGRILGLEGYPENVKTKAAYAVFQKLPVELGRRILVVMPGEMKSLELSVRNLPNVKTITAAYLNPEDLLVSKHIIFLAEAVRKAEELWGTRKETNIPQPGRRVPETEEKVSKKPHEVKTKPYARKKAAATKKTSKKKTSLSA